MSIGGIVIEVIKFPERLWVNTVERQNTSKCAVYCERNPESEKIREGDAFWWQGMYCYWTPKDLLGNRRGDHYDIKIRKLSNSGVSRPSNPEIT